MPLDHTAYPHLLDAVFAASDHGALLSLRTASSAFRDRADSALFAHISVHVADDTVYLHAPNPSFASPPVTNLPSLPFPALASRKAQEALAAKLAHTRTLDLHAPLPVEYAAWFRPYATVRRAPLAAGTLLPAHTYVEYLDVSAAGRRGPVGEWIAEVPDGVRRSVVHLSWRASSVSQVRRMHPCLPRGVEVVLLLEPAEEVGEKAANVLRELVRVGCRHRSGTTIVGLERLSPSQLGICEWEGAYQDAIKAAAEREVLERGAPSHCVKLLSWDEWRAMEGTPLLCDVFRSIGQYNDEVAASPVQAAAPDVGRSPGPTNSAERLSGGVGVEGPTPNAHGAHVITCPATGRDWQATPGWQGAAPTISPTPTTMSTSKRHRYRYPMLMNAL